MDNFLVNLNYFFFFIVIFEIIYYTIKLVYLLKLNYKYVI